jgi:hypothetical protein
MNSAGATGPAATTCDVSAITAKTELEMEAGRNAAERRAARPAASPKTSAALVSPFPLGEPIDTGIVAAAMAKQAQVEGGGAQEEPISPRAQKPIAIQPTFSTFPAELNLLDNWVLWKYVPPQRQGGKWRKVPFQPNGKTASTTDRSTWNSSDICRAAYAHGKFEGIGFVFDGELGADGLTYCGIDLDHCVEKDKTVQSLAKGRIGRLNTYTELSVSGTGVHCIVRAAPMDRIVKYDGIEIYTKARYFTFTGRAFGKIRVAPVETLALIDEVRAKEAAANQQQSGHSASGMARNEPAEANGWFGQLSPELKNQALDHALEAIATRTKYLELEQNGGDNNVYYRLMASCARSGAPSAEDLWVKWASQARDADPEDKLRAEFHRWLSAPLSMGLPK